MHNDHYCECEHISHFKTDKRTPNGNPGHKYGAQYHPNYLVKMKSQYGHYKVCKDCADDCYHPETMAKIGVAVTIVE